MHTERKRPRNARASCAPCKFWKIDGHRIMVVEESGGAPAS